jgi:hypothetical protein
MDPSIHLNQSQLSQLATQKSRTRRGDNRVGQIKSKYPLLNEYKKGLYSVFCTHDGGSLYISA